MNARILLVEDEKKIADIVKAYLEKEGFSVKPVQNGSDALEELKTGFDLIILDL
ncbi:MAG: DNA-binding response regulator, partial [Nitrospirae bacterium]